MTLFKQLFWGASIAFLIILVATETIYIRNAHKYLQEQLASHAQDVATSLGVVLPALLADKDVVKAELYINAMFDRGYYQSIRVVNLQGETFIQKSLPQRTSGVPEIFIKLFPLEAPSAESLISKGWKQLGRVVVQSHPNFAYKQLWRTMAEATASLVVLYLIALLVLNRFLQRILKPIHDIEAAAIDISQRNFSLIKSVPNARELKSVVRAFNLMSKKLQNIIEFEVGQALRFRDESTKDVMTGLFNRRGFEQYMSSLLEDDKNQHSGGMYMLQIANFQDYNKANGFQKGDKLIQSIAETIQSVAKSDTDLQARINGATFVVVATGLNRDEVVGLGNAMSMGVSGVLQRSNSDFQAAFGCGAVYFNGQGVTLNALLAQCDMSTLQSTSNGNAKTVLNDFVEEESVMGSQDWKLFIQDALGHDRLAIFSQAVIGVQSDVTFQIEVVGRLRDEHGALVPAQQFIPMANRHNLTGAIDLAIIKRLFAKMSIGGSLAGIEVAINVSTRSIHDPELVSWLVQAMRENLGVARNMVFEFSEFGLTQDRSGIETFIEMVRSGGADFAVDNFGLHQSAFEYLQKLKPRYIKLSSSYFKGGDDDRRNQFFISSVVSITRPLDIKVIALGIEQQETLLLLRNLGVDGYQGYVTGEMIEI